MRVGILGGGQLGRMLALAAHPLNITVTCLDPTESPSAAAVCPTIRGEFDDFRALYQLAQQSDVITYEFENVPVESARWLEERLPVYPPSPALFVAQDRVFEKQFFTEHQIPTPAFHAIETDEELQNARERVGLPAVLKTRRFGYDGKGQEVVETLADLEHAWQRLQGRPLILERRVPFTRELSLVAVRSPSGELRCYPLVENLHREGMLRRTLAPAPQVTADCQQRAEGYARAVMEKLNYVGVLAIEFFQENDQLVANEMAPRVHNSGHWTIEGAETSQFENHIRAVTGLPLGSTAARGYSLMLNAISEFPEMERVLRVPDAHLHLYGKSARPYRKLGHITLCAATMEELLAREAMVCQ